jgi:hypothetical protein
VAKVFTNQQGHDPADMAAAQVLATREDLIPIGILYRNQNRPRYEEFTATGVGMPIQDKLEALERELDRFAI